MCLQSVGSWGWRQNSVCPQWLAIDDCKLSTPMGFSMCFRLLAEGSWFSGRECPKSEHFESRWKVQILYLKFWKSQDINSAMLAKNDKQIWPKFKGCLYKGVNTRDMVHWGPIWRLLPHKHKIQNGNYLWLWGK